MIIASNFKTNHTRASTKDFLETLKAVGTTCEVRVFPPATALDCFALPAHIKVGVQNFYPAQSGSFTGEIGAEQVEEFEIESVLIGHSERRHLLKESTELVRQKYAFARAKDWEIIYCIGEPKEVREAGFDAVRAYVEEQLVGIDVRYERLIVAYEPVWAIGTGLSASLEQIQETHQYIKTRLNAPLLYGGSVNVENIGAIVGLEECDGVLVGSASWKKEAFVRMLEAVKTAH
ncbi:MAG: triose-phosphate isomerase [Campylobacterales bacterium]|nr:triose-phosphate isomerase [Campylobacterales bacterium]